MRTALGAQVAHRLIDLLNVQEPTGSVVLPLVNHTQPTYVADADYSKTIDGMLVTYLTTAAVQSFWEVTLSLTPKYINIDSFFKSYFKLSYHQLYGLGF